MKFLRSNNIHNSNGRVDMTSDEFVAKAASIVRHALPANMIPQVYKNALVDAIADGLAFYYIEGVKSKESAKGDIGHE